MPVTADDLKFFASQAMTDTADGGGPRSSVALQTGVSNATFPAVSASDRTTGRTRLRKVYVGPTNTDNAALLGASLAINEVPTDAAVSMAMFAFGDATTTRAAAVAAAESLAQGSGSGTFPTSLTGSTVNYSIPVTFSTGGTVVTIPYFNGSTVHVPPVGAEVVFTLGSAVLSRIVTDRFVESSGQVGSVTVDAAMPIFNSNAINRISYPQLLDAPTTTPQTRLYGAVLSPVAISSGAVTLAVASRRTAVVPFVQGSTFPSANNGINPTGFAYVAGRAAVLFVGDTVTLWHEGATTAATASNGSAVNVGRTGLDQLAVVGANGAEIARFLRGGPTPPGGTCTADLDAGTMTPVDVSAWSQPVTVRHRIAHRALVTAADGNVVTLGTPTTRAFPAGSVLSTHLPLGDLQARAYGVFGQQAWTRVFSDTLIGNAAPLPYTGTIDCTNRGAETDRWSLVFSSSADFTCYSERLGLVGAGSTAAVFAPVNAATGAPFFSLATAGWATGILVGSVLRFNTAGAAPPVWLLQCIAPSSATGTTHAALRLHGSV